MIIDWDFDYFMEAIEINVINVEVKTRSGLQVLISGVERAKEFLISGYVFLPNGERRPSSWNKKGMCWGRWTNDDLDLVLEILYVI